jgi:nicotinate phosphoribosyltransferase
MPILSCVSELFHILNGDDKKYDLALETQKVRKKTVEIFANGLILGDMGTRRRFSFDHQKMVLTQMKDVYENGKFSGFFTGTSNVWFAKELNLNPLGTMSHQIISFEENVTSVFEVNHSVMEKWASVYNGDLGLYLYDCFGDDVFFNNFSKKNAMLFSGLRVDSGNEEEQIDKIVKKYTDLGINPQTKQVIFSNGLNIKRAIEIQKYASEKVKPSFGVGTFLTCDLTGISPMNIVVKLTKSRITESREWHDCVKLSCDKGKTLGNPDKCKYLLSVI